MPTYTYICPSCEARFERYLTLSRWTEVQFCGCGHPAHRIITKPVLVVAQPECSYDSPITGEPITSWAKRTEDLAKHNCEPYDPARKQDYLKRMADDEARLDKVMGETAEEFVEKLPNKQRGQLQSELTEQGYGLDYSRSTP